MADEQKSTPEDEKKELPPNWQQVHGAIWLIGIAILAWQNWWWPGILVLVAISGLAQAGIQVYLSRREQISQTTEQDKQLDRERAARLPDVCPNCGGPLSVATVKWTGPNTADCPYCKANLKPLPQSS